MTGRALGSVRDLDVFIENARKYQENLPIDQQSDLDFLIQAWQEQRERMREKLLAYLDSRQYEEFKNKFYLFLTTPGMGARKLRSEPPEPGLVEELAPVLIYTRLASVHAFGPSLPNARLEQLHALRIEFKKLRYTVEYFQEVLGKEAGWVIDEFKKMQDHLGEIQDARVAADTLRKYADELEDSQAALPIQERQSLEGVLSYMASRHAELHRLVGTFPEAWEKFEKGEVRRKVAQAVGGMVEKRQQT
jgi:CHAD domain-containing protein